jgi:hypothetical protein
LFNRLKSYGTPLPITSQDLDTWHRWASEYESRHIQEIQTLENTGVRLAVALRTGKEVLGALLLGAPAKDRQYTLPPRVPDPAAASPAPARGL